MSMSASFLGALRLAERTSPSYHGPSPFVPPIELDRLNAEHDRKLDALPAWMIYVGPDYKRDLPPEVLQELVWKRVAETRPLADL